MQKMKLSVEGFFQIKILVQFHLNLTNSKEVIIHPEIVFGVFRHIAFATELLEGNSRSGNASDTYYWGQPIGLICFYKNVALNLALASIGVFPFLV